MSSERGLWNTMRKNVGHFGRLVRVENGCELGTPDVHYLLRRQRPSLTQARVKIFQVACGWIELKEDVWPKLARTPLLIDCLTLDQVRWHEGYERAGGRVATLAQVGRDYLWLDVPTLGRVFRRELTRDRLQDRIIGNGEFPTTAVLKKLFEAAA